jgi:hypothetical protein
MKLQAFQLREWVQFVFALGLNDIKKLYNLQNLKFGDIEKVKRDFQLVFTESQNCSYQFY